MQRLSRVKRDDICVDFVTCVMHFGCFCVVVHEYWNKQMKQFSMDALVLIVNQCCVPGVGLLGLTCCSNQKLSNTTLGRVTL